MYRTARLLLASLFSTAMIALALPTHGQVRETDAQDQNVTARDRTQPALARAEVEAALATIEADSGMEQSVKDLLRAKHKQTIQLLEEVDDLAAQAKKYGKSLSQAPAATAELRAQLEKLPPVPSAADITAPQDPDTLQQVLDTQRAELGAFTKQLSDVSAELSLVEQRPAEISVRIPEVKRELADIRQELAASDPQATSPGRVAEQFLLQAQALKLQRELEMLEQEQLSQSVRRGQLQAQEKLLTRQVENTSATVAAYEAFVKKSVIEVAQDIGVQAGALSGQVEDQEAAALAAEVQELASQLKGVLRDRQRITTAKADITAKLQGLTHRYDSIKKQLALDPPGVEMAQVLIDLRALLFRQASEVAEMRSWPMLAKARLALVQVDAKIDDHKNLQKQLADHPSAAVPDLLAKRGEVLGILQQQYLDLIPIQAALDSETRLYLQQAEEVRGDITQRLFWIRNSPALGLRTMSEIPRGLGWTLSREHCLECIQALWITTTRAPLSSALVVLSVVALFVFRPRIVAALQHSGEGVGRVSTDRIGLTGKAVVWTILLSLPIPLLVGGITVALAQVDTQSIWLRDVNRGLPAVLLVIGATMGIAACCYPGGLADVHCGWRQETLRWLRPCSRWCALIYAPWTLLAFSTISSESGRFLHNFGRASLLFSLGWLLWQLARLLSSSDLFAKPTTRAQLTQAVRRWRYRGVLLVLGCLLGLIVLAVNGYTLTTLHVSFALVITAILIIVGVMLYAFTLRWFQIEHRKLALAEALDKRRARQEAAAKEDQQEDSPEMIAVDINEQELALDAVGEQTRSVLRLLFGLGIATAVFSWWSATLPLVSYLDTIRIPLTTGFTLLEFIQALLLLAGTWLVTKNLPGILELTFLRATPLDSGTRHAITTICQYAVAATGLILFSNVLRLDWAKFGWIAGGLSVGIGFGMQEIVANFVCGLILLFERPIRVGDVVTVEGTTGTVTRLQMRSTTITNWDRQDFVVPNKTLITGTILNWTLSASLNRIVIPVGVAYGSDTERARQILLEVAAEHPRVLEDPAPLASFEEFADSALNLVLRAYLPDLDNRLGTITELHTEIDKRFAAAGIQIPFPQRDVHLHHSAP